MRPGACGTTPIDEYASKDDNIAPTNHWVPAVLTRKIEEDTWKAINPHTPRQAHRS